MPLMMFFDSLPNDRDNVERVKLYMIVWGFDNITT